MLESWAERRPLSPVLQNLVTFLHEVGAIAFGTFTLKSGITSPIFVNLFAAIRSGGGLARVGKHLARVVVETVERFELEPSKLFLFGPAYKGVPLAAATALQLSVEMGWSVRWGYDRKEAKLTGERTGQVTGDVDLVKGMVDGELRDGDSVLVIDDVLTRGDAKLEAIGKVEALARVLGLGVEVVGVVTLVDRVEGALNLRSKVPVFSALTLPVVAHHLYHSGSLSRDDYERYASYFAPKAIPLPPRTLKD